MNIPKMVFLAGLLLTGICTASRADESPGAAALASGRAALETGDFATACKDAERALEQNPKLLAARLLRGEALLASGARQKGLDRLRELLTELENAVPLSEADRALWARGRDLVVASSKPDQALHALLHKQAEKLAKIAKKYVKKAPLAAERAALAALALDPTYATALDLLEQCRAGLSGKVNKLMDATMAAWTWRSDENWPLVPGGVIGYSPEQQVITRTNRRWSGEFDVVIEVRLIEEYKRKAPIHFGMLVPFISLDRFLFIGNAAGLADMQDNKQYGGGSVGFKKLADIGEGIDPKSWVRYEVRMRKTEVIALVNGVEIARFPRPGDLKEGYIALSVQCAKVEFRRVDLIQK